MEDTPQSEDTTKPAEQDSAETKKPTRTRTTKPRVAKPRTAKPRKTKDKAEATESSPELESNPPKAQEELGFTEPSSPGETPKEKKTGSEPSEGDNQKSGATENSDAPASAESGENDANVEGAPARSRSSDRGPRRDRQRGGQDGDDWKRNKRGRGRNGNWKKGGRGGSQHPSQPAPAAAPPVEGDLPNLERFADLVEMDAVAIEISSGGGDALYLDEVYAMSLADLTEFARGYGATFEGAPNRIQLLIQIFAAAVETKRPIRDRGYIDINEQGAFIVHKHVNYRLYPEDAYLPEILIKRFGLKRGHQVDVQVQAPQDTDRCPAVVKIEKVMGMEPEEISKVTPFEELVPYYPLQRILLEASEPQKDVSMRAIDILTPIGFGQRGLIVAPPRTGKTVILQNIANSVSENFPDYTLILLLIDERPEEVTDFKRHTKGEVVSSTFDESPESHVHCAEMVGEKARRLVEQGKHVVILLDSITRLARAYNALTGNQGKTMSGGLESNALQKPKRFFGAARNIEGAGSLTIMGTALVDTGSRMDEIIFEEFKGTGNMELHLDRGLVERRIFPAINIDRSGTRKEELIYHPAELEKIYGLRRAMQGLGPIESMEMLIKRLRKTDSNAEFLMSLR